jgi:hypothetical protein
MPNGRFTAGYEVIPDVSRKESYLQPWVEKVEGFSGLILASPGRATLGYFAAQQVVQRISRLLGAPGTSNREREPLSGTGPWADDIHMHFERHYSFDDSKWDGN